MSKQENDSDMKDDSIFGIDVDFDGKKDWFDDYLLQKEDEEWLQFLDEQKKNKIDYGNNTPRHYSEPVSDGNDGPSVLTVLLILIVLNVLLLFLNWLLD